MADITRSPKVKAIAEFLYWLQHVKRYQIGGFQKPYDWLNRTLTPVSTPAVELLAEYFGRDLDGEDAETLALLEKLAPISRERQEEIKKERAEQHRRRLL